MRRKKKEGKRMWMRTSAWILAAVLLLADASAAPYAYASAETGKASVQEESSDSDTAEKEPVQELQENQNPVDEQDGTAGQEKEAVKAEEESKVEEELKVEETPKPEETGAVESETQGAMAAEQPVSEEEGAGIDLLADGETSGRYRPYEGAKYTLRWDTVRNEDGSYGDGICITGIDDYDTKENGLGSLVIPAEINGKKVTEIKRSAFSYCSGFTGDLVIPEGVTQIGDNAFVRCSGFTRIVLGAQKIGGVAFYGCTNLREIEITSEVKEWGEKVFAGGNGYPVRIFTFLDAEAAMPDSMVDRDGGFIQGYRGSTAETYAKEHNCLFIPLDGTVPEITEIKVSNTQELLDAVGAAGEGSYRHIILADGIYCIPERNESITLTGLTSVTIEAEHTGKAEILTEAGHAPVIEIIGCKDIDIKGCILGHTVERGNCDSSGDVLSVTYSFDVDIDSCDLFGCGWSGIYCNAENINVSNSILRDCMSSIVSGKIYENGLKFQNCIFSGNSYDNCDGIALATRGKIELKNCVFLNNLSEIFSNPKVTQITMEQCSFERNRWEGMEPKAGGICLNGITWQVENDVLKIGYPLQLDDGTVIQSKQGEVLDYSEYSLPWKIYDDLKKDIAPGIQKHRYVKINLSGTSRDVTFSMSKGEEEAFVSKLAASEGMKEDDWFRVDITVAETANVDQKREMREYASKRGYFVDEYLDVSINLRTEEGKTVQITHTDIPARITIERQVHWVEEESRLFSVVRMHDGEFTILKDLDDDPDTITIETDRFSPYAIVSREAGSRLKGDVNGDDEVDAKDKRLVYNHINASSPEHELTGEAFMAGDVDDSGEIDAKDKRMIYNHIAGTDLLW